MKEIKKILDNHDIAGMILLHKPGFGEYYLKIDPSYSCAKIDHAGNVRVRATQKDFKGDTDAKMIAIAETANMFKVLSDNAFTVTEMLCQISAQVDVATNAQHDDEGSSSSHTTQNN